MTTMMVWILRPAVLQEKELQSIKMLYKDYSLAKTIRAGKPVIVVTNTIHNGDITKLKQYSHTGAEKRTLVQSGTPG